MDGPKQTKTGFLFKASLVAVARSLIGLPYEHPLDTVKTLMQSNSTTTRASTIIKQLYTKNGIKGFYSGVLPNTCRIVFKSMYRMPLVVYLPGVFSSTSKKLFTKQLSPEITKTLAGITIAMFEVLVLTPAERLKVWLMTHQEFHQKKIRYFVKNSDSLGKEMFRGLRIMYLRQMASWVSFLLADEAIKGYIRRRDGIQATQKLSFGKLLIVSMGVCVANNIFVQPLDFIKTKIQAEQNKRVGIRETIIKNYTAKGFGVFYTGWRVRMLHYMIQSILTVNVYEILETSYKRLTQK